MQRDTPGDVGEAKRLPVVDPITAYHLWRFCNGAIGLPNRYLDVQTEYIELLASLEQVAGESYARDCAILIDEFLDKWEVHGTERAVILKRISRGGRKPKDDEEAEPEVRGDLGIWASQIEPETVPWLWPGYIPSGMLTIFAGQGGTGKTFVLCDLASRLSSGLEWPMGDGECPKPSNVLYISGEDTPKYTLVPRLIAQGADLNRVRFFRPETVNLFTLSNIEMIEQAIAEMGGAALVVIDPPSCFLGEVNGKRVDSHSDSDVRQVLGPLHMLAERMGISIIFNSHINKANGKGVDAQMRVIGSVGWVNTARASYLFTKDEDEPSRRIFSPIKINIGPEPSALSYQIVPSEPMPELKWLGQVDITADEAMNGRDEKKSMALEAQNWVIQQFRMIREWRSSDLEEKCKEEFGDDFVNSMKKAKVKLGVMARRVGKEWLCWVPEAWPHL